MLPCELGESVWCFFPLRGQIAAQLFPAAVEIGCADKGSG
jgi:hypothetical protein